ncbi:Transposon TX1 uncharacterized 149 kDa protein [Eumeta japonica]|uniref:Transposon TX1 uncharacterized 149 kDa protein n=1 Tax=Eumeta variegata TaxID=151549 RepID=A0A4C1WPX2_EUMVA|nr:Transposon TX1 uncharacterized 149 kDa protein [Eumeta japonica]
MPGAQKFICQIVQPVWRHMAPLAWKNYESKFLRCAGTPTSKSTPRSCFPEKATNKVQVYQKVSRGCLPEQSLSGFEQGHTGTRTRSPRAAVYPSHYSFQGWLESLPGLVPGSSIVFLGDKFLNRGIKNSRLDCGEEIRNPSRPVPWRGETGTGGVCFSIFSVCGGMDDKIEDVCELTKDRQLDILCANETKRMVVVEPSNADSSILMVLVLIKTNENVTVFALSCQKDYLNMYIVTNMRIRHRNVQKPFEEREEFWADVRDILMKCKINEGIVILGNFTGWVYNRTDIRKSAVDLELKSVGDLLAVTTELERTKVGKFQDQNIKREDTVVDDIITATAYMIDDRNQSEIMMDEIMKALKRMKVGKTTGYDKVSSEMLRNDLEKGYARVKRNDLQRTLSMHSVSSGLIHTLQTLYRGFSACIRINGAYTDWFDIGRGVRQRCVTSRWLFNVFIDSSLYYLNKYECKLRMDELSIKELMYADDQVILAPSACGLQEIDNEMDDFVKRRVKGSSYIDKISPRQGKIAQGKRDPYAAIVDTRRRCEHYGAWALLGDAWRGRDI